MSENKALWQRAFTTDPRAVKSITGKQYKGNSPKPYWIVERLTDEFGPCGLGWGFTILGERFERFGEGANAEALHIAVLRFWYRQGADRGEFEQVGQTRASYTSAAGKFIVDEDAPKKSVTDALVKCASYLGFAGDIFSGMWDDSKYVEWAGAEWDRRYQDWQASADGGNDQHFGLVAARAKIVRAVAGAALQLFNQGDEFGAYGEVSALTDNDEKLALWSILKPHSALRSAIKRMAEAETAAQRKLEQERQAVQA